MDRRNALKNSALLMGAGLASTVFSNMLQGCTVDTSEDWTPLFLTKEEGSLVAEMAGHILPATETPGAKEVLVHRFIDHVLAGSYTTEQQNEFKEGLASLDAECKETTGNGFVTCNKEERDAFVATREAVKLNPDQYLWGNLIVSGGEPSFYRKLKGLILFGYFTSEEIGKNVLNYNPVPGKFVGCVPLEAV